MSSEKRIRRSTVTKATGSVKFPPQFVLGVGNPLLDILSHVEKAFLDKYGLQLNNAILAEEKHQPMYKEMTDTMKVEFIAGGATQNSIRVAQWMMQSPGATAFIGSVGKDEFAKTLRASAAKDGVETLYYEDSKNPTGTCGVCVHQGERSLIANLAAANAFSYSHLATAKVKKALEQARIVYSAGFFLTLPDGPKSIMEIAEHCSKTGKVFCTNLAAPFIAEFFNEPLMQLIHHAEFVFGNESEAEALAKKLGWDSSDLTEVAAKVAALPKSSGTRGRTVVFTQGKDPTIVFSEGSCTLYPVVALEPSKLLDTNGAGDAFVGGFLSKLAVTEFNESTRDLDACVRAGQYASRVIIQMSGCTFPEFPDHV